MTTRYLSPTTFTGRETLFLLNLAKLGGWHVTSPSHAVRRTEEGVGETCPLCAYGNAKAGRSVTATDYGLVDQYLPAWLRGKDRPRFRIVRAADRPDDPRRPEMLRLLGIEVTP